jgi:hypothetical protein
MEIKKIVSEVLEEGRKRDAANYDFMVDRSAMFWENQHIQTAQY